MLDFGDLMDPNVLGKFKDAWQGSDVSIPILEVVAFRAKTYSVRAGESKSHILKNNGVPGKAIIVTSTSAGIEAVQEEVVERTSLSHQHFLDTLAGVRCRSSNVTLYGARASWLRCSMS